MTVFPLNFTDLSQLLAQILPSLIQCIIHQTLKNESNKIKD